MPRTITVDFYLVRVTGGDSFQQAMTKLQEIPADETRNMTFRDAPVRLVQISQDNQNWEGDVMKIRLNEAAVLASINGQIEPISVDETRGLGENTAFLYDHSLNVIAVQRNKTAVNACKLSAYIQEKGGLKNAVIFEPLFRAEVMAKLGDMSKVKKFHIKIARPTNLANIVQDAPTLAKAAQLAHDFQSPTVEIVLSVGKLKSELDKNSIVAAVKDLVKLHDQDNHSVQKIEVSGKYADDQATDGLDLIEERLHAAIPIELSPIPGEFYNRRRELLRAALAAKREEIESLVGHE